MSNVVSWIIKAHDQFSATAKNVTTSLQHIERAAVTASSKIAFFQSRLKNLAHVGKELTHLTAPIAAAGVAALHAAGKYQQLSAAFISMRGSAQAARAEMRDIQHFARKSPFTFFDVAASEKLYRQSRVGPKHILKVMQETGDIASGAGLPLQRLTTILSKVTSQGFVMTRESNQLRAYHVDVVGKIASRYHMTRMQAIKDLTKKGAVPSSILFEILDKDYTAKGKMFAGQMEKQLHTIPGSFNKMKEGFEVTGIFFGLFLDKVLKLSDHMFTLGNILQDRVAPFFEFFTTKKAGMREYFDDLHKNNKFMYDFMTNIKDNYPSLEKFMGWFLKFTNVLIIAGPAMYVISKAARLLAIVFSPLWKTIMMVATALRWLVIGLVEANPWAIAIAGVSALAMWMYQFFMKTEQGRKALIALKQEFKNIWKEFGTLFKKLDDFKNKMTGGKAAFPLMELHNRFQEYLHPSKSKPTVDVNINLTGNTDSVSGVKLKGNGATGKVNKLGTNMVTA